MMKDRGWGKYKDYCKYLFSDGKSDRELFNMRMGQVNLQHVRNQDINISGHELWVKEIISSLLCLWYLIYYELYLICGFDVT